jgi:hypothetical protein
VRRALCLMVMLVSCAAGAVTPRVGAADVLPNRTLPFGSTYTVTGHTGTKDRSSRHTLGTITLLGSWNAGPWHVIAETRAKGPSGLYRIVLRPTRRGVLSLRLETPDPASYTVQLTVT